MSSPKQPMKTGTKAQSEPKLSEVARHIVRPSGIVSTGWNPVRVKLRDLGIRFQLWQQGAARLILAKREDGLYAAGIGGVVISIPRQVGKTFLIGAIIFALCLLHPNLTVIWTAHRVRTARETFRAMQGFARRKSIAPFVDRVIRGAGDEAVAFKNGSRILFGARQTGFGRGFTKVDILVFDEAQILQEDALDDMVPATNQSPNPLVIFTGTPPKATDPGEVFTRFRRESLAGEVDDVLYIELSADPDCDPEKWPTGFIDWTQVAKANPSFPKWTPRAAVMRMLRLLGLASFRLEGLGIWLDEAAERATIKKSDWNALRAEQPPTGGQLALGVKFSVDGLRVSLSAVRRPLVGPLYGEVLADRLLADGLGWLVDVIVKSWRQTCGIVIDGKAGRDLLVGELVKAGVPKRMLILPNTDEVIAAHTMTLQAVNDSTVNHGNQPGLNASVASAAQRKIGNMGGWGWEAIGDGDVVPLESFTLALWAASTSKLKATGSVPRRIS